jgi:hypothetical protein
MIIDEALLFFFLQGIDILCDSIHRAEKVSTLLFWIPLLIIPLSVAEPSELELHGVTAPAPAK